jgi:hypothetical protein
MINDDESIAAALDHVLVALDIMASMALDEDRYQDVAAEEIRIGQVISRAQLILSFIDAREPEMRAVQ